MKILLGFLILTFMLFASGALSVFELTKLGNTVKGLISENYKSISYAKQLLEELEGQEKSILNYLSSNDKQNIENFIKSHELALFDLDSAGAVLVETNEDFYIDSITVSYEIFYLSSLSFMQDDSRSLNTYLTTIYPKYIKVAHNINQLMTINQRALYKTSAYLEASAQRVVMPGLIVILTSIVFTLIFVFLVNYYFVSPIIKLTKGINDYVKYQKPFEVQIESKDELSSLKDSIANLITQSRSGNKKKTEI